MNDVLFALALITGALGFAMLGGITRDLWRASRPRGWQPRRYPKKRDYK